MKTLLSILLAALACVIVAGCFSSSPRQENNLDSYLDDKVTADRVENSLHHLLNGEFASVHAESTNGMVYLTGAVATLKARQQAGEFARKIDGVKMVHNGISIR